MEVQVESYQQQLAIAIHNERASSLNGRLCSVLAAATGDVRPASPEDWYQWWDDYNEVTKSGDKPTNFTYEINAAPIVTIGQAPQYCSCLAAGTPVLTELGSVAIERVRVGDRVLACDCESGCLALKPVLKTTVNPGAPLVRLRTAGETLDVTGGHVFWISGHGWIKARELQPEIRFHTLEGTVDLASIESGDRQKTYNLVVADFHTYFVGKEKILTHDITIRKPTDRIVPGLASTKR
jgi:hypothetical protein